MEGVNGGEGRMKVKIVEGWLDLGKKIGVNFHTDEFKAVAYAQSIKDIPDAIKAKIAELRTVKALEAELAELKGKTIEIEE